MKLRIKTLAEPNQTHRVEVDGACTVHQLHDAVQAVVSGANHALPLQLSINKKHPLDSNSTLQQLGICNGDLIWVLTPAAANNQNMTQASQDTQRTLPKTTSAELAHARTPDQPVKKARPGTAKDMLPNMAPGANGSQSQSEAATDHMDVEQAEDLPAAQGPVVPGHLLRAVMGMALQSLTSHRLLQTVVQAAMLETGFQVLSQSHDRVKYALPLPGAAAAAAVAPEAGTSSSSTSQDSLPPSCQLVFLPLGKFLVVHAVVASPPHAAAAPAASSSSSREQQAAKAAAVQTLHLDVQRHTTVQAQAAAAGAVDVTSSVAVAQYLASCFQDLPKLWLLIKEQLSLWALSRIYQEAGLTPPIGLLTLPSELKYKIFKSLKPRDLVAVSGACSELRHLTNSEQLWEALYRVEFPNASNQEVMDANQRGWRWGFARQWARRKERRRAQGGLVWPPHLPAYPRPMPGGPPIPHLPFGLPVIGGDYDRLPQPFLGSGPGMLPSRRAGMPPFFGRRQHQDFL